MTLVEVLQEVEWQPRVYDGDVQYECPICGGVEPWPGDEDNERYGHSANCELAYWLKACREEQAILPWVNITTEDIMQERGDE